MALQPAQQECSGHNPEKFLLKELGEKPSGDRAAHVPAAHAPPSSFAAGAPRVLKDFWSQEMSAPKFGGVSGKMKLRHLARCAQRVPSKKVKYD